MPTALITGIAGQDGKYLAHLLLGKGYSVVGMVHDVPARAFEGLPPELGDVNVRNGDLRDLGSLIALLDSIAPDEIYNLASQSAVDLSYTEPRATIDATFTGAVNMFEAVRIRGSKARVYQASSSELYGKSAGERCNEDTRLTPLSPYAVSKAAAHQWARMYRESYGMPIACGILFNHESPLRGLGFVTRKVARAVALHGEGVTDRPLQLGDITKRRDWGFAGDYVRAMWMAMQQEQAADWIVATGVSRSVEDLLDAAYAYVGIKDWRPLVRTGVEDLIRPADPDELVGDAHRANVGLGWAPKVGFEQLVELMVDAEVRRIRGEEYVIGEGLHE